VCIRTQGKGLVWDEKTFDAPNGMSITAKGGLFGSIAQYKISWFDKDKKLISAKEETYYESGANDRRFYVPQVYKRVIIHKRVWTNDRRFYVPQGAAYVKYKIGTTASGKDKPETDYLPAGNAIYFFEGAAGTENGHLKAQNANGYEVYNKDFKL